MFEVLLVKHQWGKSKLYHIDIEGKAEEVKGYKSIGSGTKTADMFCSSHKSDQTTMKDFTKRAFLSIEYMDQYHPDLGVGIGPGDIPLIKHMDFSQEGDEELTISDPFIAECRKYTNQRMKKSKESFEAMLKE